MLLLVWQKVTVYVFEQLQDLQAALCCEKIS